MAERIIGLINSIESQVLSASYNGTEDQSLFCGKLSFAYYLLSALEIEPQRKQYQDLLAIIVSDIFHGIQSGTGYRHLDSLFEGLPGLGWLVFDLIQSEFLEAEEYKREVETINNLAFQSAMEFIDKESFDYFYGCIGCLYYLNQTRSFDLCEKIVDRLFHYGETNQYIFYNHSNDRYTEGINFGFAHGCSGMVAVLTDLYISGISKPKTSKLIFEILNLLLTFKRECISVEMFDLIDTKEDIYPSLFPYNVFTDQNRISSYSRQLNCVHYSGRLGWCNSDLNILYLLQRVGSLFSVPRYLKLFDVFSQNTLNRRKVKDTQIDTYYLCHGSSGVALIYKNLFLNTGKQVFKNAHHYWLNKTMNFLNNDVEHFSSSKIDMLTGWLGPLLLLKDHYYNRTRSRWEKLFLM